VTADEFPHTFTVFTPTFNRAHTLPRVYESLRAQTMTDFEWLVVDDGSTDETRTLVADWAADASFPIRYVYQANRGKHVAENLAVQTARGRFITTVDSDDWLLPDALETFVSTWNTIPPQERAGFAGVVGLCATADGTVIGDRFPADVFDTTYVELALRHRITGDKAGFGRTEVARAYRQPVVPGETLVVEFIVYAQIAKRYRIRCVNRVVKTVEYQPSGLSASRTGEFIRNPRTTQLFFREHLSVEPMSFRERIRVYTNHSRYAFHAGAPGEAARDSPSKLLWAGTLPLAAALFARDRMRFPATTRAVPRGESGGEQT
jgi:glycosyltransferase involved in cell wall biosynthesis